MAFLEKYFDITSTMNTKTFFEMLATEVVEDAADADVIVSDEADENTAEIIRSYDFERVLQLINE